MSDCRIIFVFSDVNGDYQIEQLNASKTGSCFKIESIPFYTQGIAKGDIVVVTEKEDELHFDMTILPSGNSTIQIFFYQDSLVEPAMQVLEQLGCTWETAHAKKVVALNVPSDVQYSLVQHFLEKGDEEMKWSFREACLSHY